MSKEMNATPVRLTHSHIIMFLGVRRCLFYTAAGACGALGAGLQVVGGRAFEENPATHIRVQGTAKVHKAVP